MNDISNMSFRCFQAFVLFRYSFVKVVDPVDAAKIDQQKIQMIKVKLFNERIHSLKKSNYLCNTLLYHLPNIGMSTTALLQF